MSVDDKVSRELCAASRRFIRLALDTPAGGFQSTTATYRIVSEDEHISTAQNICDDINTTYPGHAVWLDGRLQNPTKLALAMAAANLSRPSLFLITHLDHYAPEYVRTRAMMKAASVKATDFLGIIQNLTARNNGLYLFCFVDQITDLNHTLRACEELKLEV